MKKILMFLLPVVFAVVFANAQIVTTSPSPVLESSSDVVLTYHANSPLGNNGLANLPASTAVYAHIGVITNLSKSDSDWKYATSWPSGATDATANTSRNKLTYVSANTYTLSLGKLRTYFGITDKNEYIKKIALVFRDAAGSKEGKTKSGGDIFVDVVFDGFAIDFTSTQADRFVDAGTKVTYTVNATKAGDLSISVGSTVIAQQSGVTTLSADYTFTTPDNYIITAKGVYNGETYTKTIAADVTDPGMKKTYPGGVPRQGAVKNADGTVTFCLAAPGKGKVVLMPSWDNYEKLAKNEMYYHDYNGNRYFWITVSGLANDEWYSYFYCVDDKYNVGDPYANLVLDCYNDKYIAPYVYNGPKHPGKPYDTTMMAAYRGDMHDYEFSDFEIPSHDNLVIYEMLFRDFTGTDGHDMGSGTVKKAMEKIPYLKSLGVNAVELMPIMEFNGNKSWGYNTNFYFAPDKAYGSPTDYKDFIEECHANGIAVILDIVFNQSDGLHPWYQMYPIESNPFYNKEAPHSYSVLNDWKQDNALVEQQWCDALRYWLEKYNVDGFRFDLVKGLGNNDSYKGGTDGYNQSRIDRMIRLHKAITDVKPDAIHINELLGSASEENKLSADGQLNWANINNASCQFAMGWDNGDYNLRRFYSTYDGNRQWGTTVSYAESHDEERMGYKCGEYGKGTVKTDLGVRYDRLGALAVQMLLTPGPKMIWQFGEFGNDQTTKDKNGGNDTGNKLVDWKTWLADENCMFLKDVYAALINLRIDNPELFANGATFNVSNLGSNYTRERTMRLAAGNKEVVAFINPSVTDAMTVNFTSNVLTPANAQLVTASKGLMPTLNGTGTALSVTLPANGFAVFSTNNIAGVDTPVADLTAAPNVYGGNGCIIINGEYEHAEVFDLSGRRLPSLEVPAGLYIVNVDGKATKVMVR